MEYVAEIPGGLGKVIRRCLRKHPAQRFHHMSDLKVELEELKQELDSGAPRRLTTGPGFDQHPYWSHDGRTILYNTKADVAGSDIMLVENFR